MISSREQRISCLEIAFRVWSFLMPPSPDIYGGLLKTTSIVPLSKYMLDCVRLSSIISIFSFNWLRRTLRFAISATSCCTSKACIFLKVDLPESKIGMIPVPVPNSTTSSLALSLMKLLSKTASMPKQNPFGS